MTTLRQLLDGKGQEIFGVAPDDTVFRALEEMAVRNIGSVLILDDGNIMGIFTERDYARSIILKGKSSLSTPVKEVMTANVIYATCEMTVEDAMSVMSGRRLRHLPVKDGDKVIGVISIGDLVNSVITEQKKTIEQLQDFIRA